MSDHTEERNQTDFERFMSSVDQANASTDQIPLGTRLTAGKTTYTFTERNPDGIMLVSFTIQNEGQERPTNLTGMVTLLKVEPVVTIEFCHDKGIQKISVPLHQLLRLMKHSRHMGNSRFVIRDGVLIKEEITKTETAKPQEELHAAQANAGVPHRPISYPPVFETGSRGMEY
ncbi:MAG: hypothetical protein WC544_01820 [Patescibacteria group bacterium]